MSNAPTRKQRAIYDFIVDTVHRHGIPPSLTEIADAFDLVSLSGVSDHLRALQRKGLIRRRPGVSRGIEVLGAGRPAGRQGAVVAVPVIGSLPARRPLTGGRDRDERLFFDRSVVQRGAVAVRVHLDGLEARGILNGDYLVVVRGQAPRTGELALAHVRRTTVLVEKLPGRRGVRRVEDDVELSAGFEWLGKVVAVMRSMHGTKGADAR